MNGILGGTVNVQTGGRLQGIGEVGTTTSDGTIAPGNSIGTLTIDGNYTGNGGTLVIESELGGDASPTDRLVVTGATAGTTSVQVTNLGGTGGQTVGGIKIVDVGGASGGVFSLLGDYVISGQQAVVAGACGYTLNKNGVSTPGDGDWYLRSQLAPTKPPTTPPTTPPTPRS
ncbi:outer membrane autotransporter protein [Phyllobacterium sp. 1468]|uniref:autotransporter outer membrane beta-barrel domain-containing protein n=1 Tax=Phyllobacterium sp. 1468 TaxID=2817759 RepID=UPI001B3E3E01|nr:autotransporter outer membrane beta-barrel domain-containing protein [Phyllobacterium sp. 1468]MDR6635495.1 outer membrane autotransporter protein [Phyllobacterium sp. 1468]